ncbi:hypothetical protein [Psychromicrobium xiongbiense]|uniref:hypothetical protein n=1 Tax=Psychromicrobium xiongbiense TaxID=3051184 RepID=UPI0025564A02|nr:hypothetical protein [Psychromicrobium sp. YIM S02556]
MTTRGVRLLRGWICAVFATFAALASHLVGGGHSPDPLIVLLSLAISGGLCVLCIGRKVSFPRLGLSVIVSQGLFHLLFSVSLDSHQSLQPAASMNGMSRSGMLHQEGGAILTSMPVSHAMDYDWRMWLGHGAAAILTLVFLRRGDLACLRILELLRLSIVAVVRLLLLHAPAPHRLWAPSGFFLLSWRDLGVMLLSLQRRGPPTAQAAALS